MSLLNCRNRSTQGKQRPSLFRPPTNSNYIVSLDARETLGFLFFTQELVNENSLKFPLGLFRMEITDSEENLNALFDRQVTTTTTVSN